LSSLYGSLRLSACFVLKSSLNAEVAETRKGPQRERAIFLDCENQERPPFIEEPTYLTCIHSSGYE